MASEKIGSRTIKKEILELLRGENFEEAVEGIRRFPPKRVIGPLFSHFYGDDIVFWRAVSAMGIVVAGMADGGAVESARIVLRRMMWQLLTTNPGASGGDARRPWAISWPETNGWPGNFTGF